MTEELVAAPEHLLMYHAALAWKAMTVLDLSKMFLKEKFMAQFGDLSVFFPEVLFVAEVCTQALFFFLQFQMLCMNRPLASSISRFPLLQD